MADPNVDELQAASQIIFESQVEDCFGKNDPFLKYMKDTRSKGYDSGTALQLPFVYQGLPGGPFQDGDTFDMNVVDILTATQFELKKYAVPISEYLTKINIENGAGDWTKVRLIDLKMAEAVRSMTRKLAIAASQHGTIGNVSGARTGHISGWAEAINNGTDPSWQGDVFTTYGGITRNGAVAAAQNGNTYWFGDATGGLGTIGYSQMIRLLFDATVDNEMPNLLLTSKFGVATILEKFQIQQRFAQERDPVVGMESWKIMDARLMRSDYIPSLRNGEDSPDGNYLTSTFTSPASPTSSSEFPASTVCNVGEVLVALNTETFDFLVSTSALTGFGWTGWKVQFDGLMVGGQHLAACNLICRNPRLNAYGFGFGG